MHSHHRHADHAHSHPGPGGRRSDRRRLALTLGLSAVYMVAEAVGGWVTGSLALLADAGHMLSDVAALALALFALRMAERPPTRKHTYGFHRVEILAALVNGATLLAIAVLIVVEAIERLRSPHPVDAPWMAVIAAGGLVINGAALVILHGGRNQSLNLRGAWLHVLMDTLGSVQALAAGALIVVFGWQWADPVASILIAVLVVGSAGALLKETVAVLMERAPSHIDVEDVRADLLADPGVEDVHDLHVWTITSGFVALSAHVVAPDPPSAPSARTRPPGDPAGDGRAGLLRRLQDRLREGFGIEHATLQIEPGAMPGCGSCGDEPSPR